MIIVPVSFNGTSLQSTDFASYYPPENKALSPSVNPQYIKRPGAWPVISGSDFLPTTIGLEVQCLGDFMTTFETLTQVFNVEDETPRQLIIKDTTTTDEPQYSIYAIPKLVTGGDDGEMARITLSVDSPPIWVATSQSSQAFATTSATDSTSVTNAGNADAYPVFEITPTSPPAGDYAYLRYLQVIPTSTKPWPARFLDVLGSSDGTGVDTAALVTAVKMQADGDDFRLYQNKVEIDRQLSNINTTDTHMITKVDLPAARTMTLKTAIGTTDTVTEVQLSYTSANKTVLSTCDGKGRIIIDSGLGTTDTEEFTYTSKTATSTKLSFTIANRAERGTVAVDHAAGSSVRFLPYDFTVVYGNTTATAPVIDDERKPIEALTSRNTALVYSNFRDNAGRRGGIWKTIPAIVTDVNRTRSGTFTSTNDEGDTDPATAMGMKALTYKKGTYIKVDTVKLGWQNYYPDGIASIVASGEQTQSKNVWPTVSLQTSQNTASTSFTNLWTVSAQTSSDYGTWTTWSKASSDATPGSNKYYLRWYMDGSQSGTINDYSKVDITSLTVGLSNPPHIMIRAEQSNYQFHGIIRNETTGDFFELKLPMELNDTVYVDTNPDFPTVTYKGQLINGAIKISSTRSEWLRFAPGANTIGFEAQNGAFDVTINVKWYTRKRFM